MSPARLSTVVLDAHDAHELAGFYVRLLDYEVRAEEPDWVLIGPPPGRPGTALAFETEAAYVEPVWPTRRAGDQQMMLHLDIEVDDLAAETARAVAAGARIAAYQPQDDVRVLLDPSGHPFCLWVESTGTDTDRAPSQ
ncbi:VOC family protein [Streptomyces antibioticus]|uniref:VOC family protein n=1 Tax=Streptomyces antibioticus TaxID=1890 RepID=UPI00225264AC|nr:VOC family protein [Streptomyces antibioticus]MCX5169957.1 VOC family protein [Streptomyces antibioticus]